MIRTMHGIDNDNETKKNYIKKIQRAMCNIVSMYVHANKSH